MITTVLLSDGFSRGFDSSFIVFLFIDFGDSFVIATFDFLIAFCLQNGKFKISRLYEYEFHHGTSAEEIARRIGDVYEEENIVDFWFQSCR